MHELSLAMEVIGLASTEAERNRVSRILEMDIVIGTLSGVDPGIFRSALEMVVSGTLLETTTIHYQTIHGWGRCSQCNHEFEMKERLELCPLCQGFPSEISGGQEFRVVSMVAE